MSKKTLVTVLSILVILLPFVGLPNSLSTPLYVLLGIGIMFIARSGRRKQPTQRELPDRPRFQ